MQRHHARLVDQSVRQLRPIANVVNTATHQSLDGGDGIERVFNLRVQRFKTDLTPFTIEVAHHAGQNHPTLLVRQAFRYAITHAGHQRVGRAQVDAHRNAAFVRVRCLPGFGNLKKCHVVVGSACLLSQLVHAGIDLTGKALGEHKASNLPGGGGEVFLDIDQLL